MDQFRDKAQLAGEGDSVSYGSCSSDSSSENYFYNSKKKELLGRTISSWMKLISFYFLFTAILALIWGLCMGVLIQTVDFYIPKLIDNQRNPGLGFRPAGGLGYKNDKGPDSPASVYSSLIWFKHGGQGNWQQLKENLDIFLAQYEPGFFGGQGSSLTKCSFENDPLKIKAAAGIGTLDDSCEFNKEWLSDQGADFKCISEEDYGYRQGKPCFLLKLNKIYDWRPMAYTYDQVKNHTTMPEKLKLHIDKVWQDKCGGYTTSGYTAEGEFRPCPWLNMAWLHCDGENAADIENIGPVTYTPFRGFPGYYFPFRNQRGYLSPIVMVQLQSAEPGVLMNIECTVWAANIDHDRVKRRGLTHFELIME